MLIVTHTNKTVTYCSVLQDVEANTVRLEEHGKTVLVLEKSADCNGQGGAASNNKWATLKSSFFPKSSIFNIFLKFILIQQCSLVVALKKLIILKRFDSEF